MITWTPAGLMAVAALCPLIGQMLAAVLLAAGLVALGSIVTVLARR